MKPEAALTLAVALAIAAATIGCAEHDGTRLADPSPSLLDWMMGKGPACSGEGCSVTIERTQP